MKPKLILLIGATFSGKSGWAKTYVNSSTQVVRICPEEMEVMLRNNKNIQPAGKRGLLVGIESLIISLLGAGYTVILDTLLTLDIKFVDYMIDSFESHADMKYRIFDQSLVEIAKTQDRLFTYGKLTITKSIGEITDEVEAVEGLKHTLHVMEQAKYISKFETTDMYESILH